MHLASHDNALRRAFLVLKGSAKRNLNKSQKNQYYALEITSTNHKLSKQRGEPIRIPSTYW